MGGGDQIIPAFHSSRVEKNADTYAMIDFRAESSQSMVRSLCSGVTEEPPPDPVFCNDGPDRSVVSDGLAMSSRDGINARGKKTT